MTDEVDEMSAASRGSGLAQVVRSMLAASVLGFAGGCAPSLNGMPETYVVRIYRPDGTLHREYRGTCSRRPTIFNTRGGAAWVRLGDRVIDAATGWQIEVDQEVENN
jgi:hypothetical protein